jgi:hypothetical protein
VLKEPRPHEKILIMGRKIVVNRCYGGFSLSKHVKALYKEATKDIPRPENWFMESDVRRDDPVLIKIIEDVGIQSASSGFSKLRIIEIPDDVPADGWMIQDYDGMEWVAEKHRTWCE